MLQSSERRFFFLPAREPKPSEAKEKFRKQKASFGAHAHRHLYAPARLYLYRSPSPRVKGLAGSSARGRREQLSDGRERESARPEKTVSLFAPKARGEKKEPNFPHGRNAPRSPSLVPSCFSLSLSTVLAHLGVHAAQEVIKLLDGGAPVWALAVRRDPGERLRRAPAARAVLPRGGIVVLSRGVVGVLEPQIVGEELLLGRARRQAQRDDGLRHAGAKGKTKRENRGRDQILFFLLFFFFLLERILKFQFMVAVEAGKKKVFFRPPLLQSLLLFSVSRLQVRKSDQLRAGALFLCLCLCRLCGSDAQSLSLGKKEREEERGGLPLLSPVSSLSLARALFSLLLLLRLFTLLSFSVSLSHFRSSLLREKLLLCPT